MKQIEGRMIIKTGFESKSATNVSIMEEAGMLSEVERYLNDRVASEIYNKWKVAVRFHILENKKGG